MNKLFTKIAGLGLGLALAIGVGAAIGSESGAASRVNADSESISQTQLNLKSKPTGTALAPWTFGTLTNYCGCDISGKKNATTATYNFATAKSAFAALDWSTITSYTLTLTIGIGLNSSAYSSSNAAATLYYSSSQVGSSVSRGTGSYTWSGGTTINDSFIQNMNKYDYEYSVNSNVSQFDRVTIGIPAGHFLLTFAWTFEYEASSSPTVSLTKTGSTTVMLNKDGSATSVTGLTASSSNITNPVYKWEIVNPSKEDMATISGTGTTPTMSVTKDGTLEVKVSARASADPDEAASYTACTSNVSLTINPYGGSIAWTNASSLTFKEDAGFDFSTTGIATTMNDGSTVNYGGDYSSIHLYVGSDEVDDNDVDASYCATSREYKLYDSVRDVWSSAVSTTLTYSAKATITALTSVAGITEISTGQSIYLKTTISSGYGNTVTYSTESSLIVVDSSTGLITSKNSSGDNIVVTATLASGDSADFTMKVSASRTYTVQEVYDMVTGFGGDDNSYYGSNSQYYLVEGIYYEDNSSYYLVDDASNPTIRLRMYSYSSWTVASGVPAKNTFVNGGKLTISAKLQKYSSTNCTTDLMSGSIKAYKGPAASSFDISGGTEVLMGEPLQLSITNILPSGASADVTWETSDDNNSVVVDGEFLATKSGVYTVTATSTDEKEGGGYASDTHEIHVYEYQETVLALKDSPKTSYFKDEYVESGLVTATVKYKCGETLNYKSEVVDAANVAPSYTYGGAALTDSQFKTVNATGATLAVTSVVIQSSIIEDPFEITSGLSGLTVSDVKVFAVEIDLENCVITPTYDTQSYTMPTFAFGDTFSHAGSITVKYKNNYPQRVVDLTNATVEEYNMKKIGVQAVKVYVDDSEYSGVSKAYVGSYNIKVTNVGSAGNAGGTTNKTLETSTTTSGLTENSESSKKALDSTISNVTKVTLTFSAEITGNTGTSFTHGMTFKLYNNSNVLVATSSQISVTTKAIATNTWTTEMTFNTQIEVKYATYTLTSKASSSNVRVRSFAISVVNTNANFANEQAQAMANYLSEFKTCVSGWNSRNDIKNLVTEYNAMIADAKTAFEALTITDYDWEKESEYNINTHTYGGGTASRTGVSAIQKLKDMVATYNSSLEQGEQQLVLNTPSGSFSSYSAISLGAIVSSNSATLIIIIASIISLTAIGGYFLFKKKRQ